MNTKTPMTLVRTLAAVVSLGFGALAHGQTIIQDNFTGASTSFNWQTFLGACLTAGDGTGTIPKCVGDGYYTETQVGGTSGTLPDTAPNGALRFTNGSPGGFNQAGAIISNFTFPSDQGLQVTFTTLTYRGNSLGGTSTATGGYNLSDGADGISFFLMDGSWSPYDVGAFGGSLGYTCSNVNNDTKLHPLDSTTRHYDGMMRRLHRPRHRRVRQLPERHRRQHGVRLRLPGQPHRPARRRQRRLEGAQRRLPGLLPVHAQRLAEGGVGRRHLQERHALELFERGIARQHGADDRQRHQALRLPRDHERLQDPALDGEDRRGIGHHAQPGDADHLQAQDHPDGPPQPPVQLQRRRVPVGDHQPEHHDRQRPRCPRASASASRAPPAAAPTSTR